MSTPLPAPAPAAAPAATDTVRTGPEPPVLADGWLNPRLFPELALAERTVESFDAGYSMGWAAGWDAGHAAAERDMAAAWARTAGQVRRSAGEPSHCTLMRRRGEHPAGRCRDWACPVSPCPACTAPTPGAGR